MDTAQQKDTNLIGKKERKKEELMLDLTAVSVGSLLNTARICSSQRATGNCSIYKPEERKHKQQQQHYYNYWDSRRQENQKDLRESFVPENILFSLLAGCSALPGKSGSHTSTFWSTISLFTTNALNRAGWRRGLRALWHALLVLICSGGSIVKLYRYCLRRRHLV